MARIQEYCTQAGNQLPAIRENGDFIDIEFHRTPFHPKEKSSEKSSEKGSEKTPLLTLIEANPKASAKVLSEALGITSRAVEKQISQLKKQGQLQRIGPAKGGYWKVIKA